MTDYEEHNIINVVHEFNPTGETLPDGENNGFSQSNRQMTKQNLNIETAADLNSPILDMKFNDK